MKPDLFVPRPAEAEQISQLIDPDPIFGEVSGLFLAAPRRTGKSTFLRRDLVPLLKQKNCTVLYVDLWSDRSSDPSSLIINTIAHALEEHDGIIAKLRRSVPISGLGALGFRVDLKSAGPWQGTIPDALYLLAEATDGDVVMIVDEAQHSLTSEAGRNAMYALKAARDYVNQSDLKGHLYLLMTGSHRDKLAALVHDHQAPFFGANIRPFPTLGRDYTDTVAERINARLIPEAKIDPDAVERAFVRLGRRPERLNSCLRDLLIAPVMNKEALEQLVDHSINSAREQMLSEISNLSELQQALLRSMAQEGIDFSPFSEDTREKIKILGKSPSKSAIQKALDTLREKGLIWRPGVGQYVLESAELTLLLQE